QPPPAPSPFPYTTLFRSAGMHEIVAQLEAEGTEVQRDPFGHVKLDTINPGQWFAKQFAARLGAEKVMVQKSGYFSRAAAPNAERSEEHTSELQSRENLVC